MIIELFGLPGSGKSTLARKLHAQGFVMIKVKGVLRLVWYNILFFIFYPRAAFRLFVLLLKNIKPWPLAYMKCMNSFLQHNAKYIQAKKTTHAIIDQGHLQNILSLFEYRLEKSDIESYVSVIPPVDYVVAFNVSDDVRNSRLKARGSYPRAHMSHAYVKEWTACTKANFETAQRVLQEKNVPTIVLGDEDIETCIHTVTSRIV